jgi:CheY-like chemotaxis protein
MATVLLVDDEDSVREVLRLWAEALGLEVVAEAVDGRAAVDLAAGIRPDAIILDHEMPKMTGLEAMPRLRRRVPESLIVFYSSGSGETQKAVLAMARTLG